MDYFIAAGSLYFATFFYSVGRTFFNTGIHYAHIEPADANTGHGLVRISVLTAMRWKPGQHIFIRFMTAGVHAVTIHPFSICSLADRDGKASEMVFYIRPKSGFTARLARKAASGSSNPIPILLDGPYGGLPTGALTGYEQVLLIAGGSGAGFLLPLLEDLVRCTCNVPDSQRTTVLVVLAVRRTEEAKWFKTAVGAMLHGDTCTCNIHMSVYITGDAKTSLPVDEEKAEHFTKAALLAAAPATAIAPEVVDPEKPAAAPNKDNKEPSISAASSKDTLSIPRRGPPVITSYSNAGRPNLPHTVATSVADHNSVAIAACGPNSMLLDVRNAAAAAQFGAGKGKDVYLHTESFSW